MNTETVNIIVPYGHNCNQPEREGLLHFVIEQCITTQTYKDKRIVLVEGSENPTQEKYASNHCDEYYFVPLEGKPFSPGVVQNQGFILSSPSSLTYIHQADFLLSPDAIQLAVDKMQWVNAPAIFPYYSAVNLSKPVSETIVNGQTDWQGGYLALVAINTKARENIETRKLATSHRRLILTDEDIQTIDKSMPPELSCRKLEQMTTSQLWGKYDGAYSYLKGDGNDLFRWVMDYRIGPRAKASYLVRSDAYEAVGGAPEIIGWGPEDLGFWERIKAMFEFGIKGDNLVYKNTVLTGTMPLVHLWHSISGNPDYYANTDQKFADYERFKSLSKEEKLASLKPIHKRQSLTT